MEKSNGGWGMFLAGLIVASLLLMGGCAHSGGNMEHPIDNTMEWLAGK